MSNREIVLIRHGKPVSAANRKVNAAGFAGWVRQYHHARVSEASRPAFEFQREFAGHYVVASDLPRAIHSCEIATGKAPADISALYREMAIPRYKLPLRLRAWSWVYLNRGLWMLGKTGPFESYNEARQRARLAVTSLINLSETHHHVVLFAHGYLNLHLRRYLQQEGWQLQAKSNQYWGVTRLCKSDW